MVADPITLAEIEADPYPVFERLRRMGPIGWIEPLQMWWVVGYEEVQAILANPAAFTTRFESSTIFNTFGEHMLTSEGAAQERYRAPFRGGFSPKAVRQAFEAAVGEIATNLVQSFAASGRQDIRSAFASRLPVQVMLKVFGLSASAEADLRIWYDSFERALANFTHDPAIARDAHANIAGLHHLLQTRIDAARRSNANDLLGRVVNETSDTALSDDEIKRNAAIIIFGGVSTVEALILNSLFALGTHPDIMAAAAADRSLIAAIVEETARWLSPVQSATRHVVEDIKVAGISLKAGATVNCMLGAANHDSKVFSDPRAFRPGRPEARRHLAFAAGPHFCMGAHLARLETVAALNALFDACPDLSLDPAWPVEVEGYEFRQPKALRMIWQTAAGSMASCRR